MFYSRFNLEPLSRLLSVCTAHFTGGNLPWFWVRTCGWSTRTPPHSYTRPSEKTWPIHILPIWKLTPLTYFFFQIYPFIYFLGEKDTPLIYFWCENYTHSYTWRPEKYIPYSRTSVYNFIMEVTPPPVAHLFWVYTTLIILWAEMEFRGFSWSVYLTLSTTFFLEVHQHASKGCCSTLWLVC